MQTLVRRLDVFADYFQFYVCDEDYQTDTGTIWDEKTTDRMLALGADLVAVGTARNMDVPVAVEVHDAEPDVDLDVWDQVIDCSLYVPTGRLIVFGCTENPNDAERMNIVPGTYAARVSYARLADLSDDGLSGEDNYRVQLWPAPLAPVNVLKRRAN